MSRLSRIRALIALVILSNCWSVHRTLAVVGYVNEFFRPGDNLIANPLDAGSHMLNDIILNGVAPGSTFKLWDPDTQQFLPTSTYDGLSWSINYEWNLGTGAILNSPVMATNTFVGDVVLYTNILTEFLAQNHALHSNLRWQPDYANGLYLLSVPDPISAPMDQTFAWVTGRNPNDGEWVQLFDPDSQSYLTTTYHTGSGWDNGDPVLGLAQAAWFNLGPVAAPEPSTLALGTFAAAVLMLCRRAHRRRT